MTQFYSYLWLRKDGTPWYAGKGTGNRAWLCHKGHRPPKDKSRIVIYPAATEAEAFASEKVFIDLFGRKDIGTGCLRNLTDGGDGHSGYVPTAAHREKTRQKSTGNQNMLGRKHTDKSKLLMSVNSRGPKSAEARENMSKAKRGKILPAHTHEAARLANLNRKPSAESLAKMSEARRLFHERKFLKTVAWG